METLLNNALIDLAKELWFLADKVYFGILILLAITLKRVINRSKTQEKKAKIKTVYIVLILAAIVGAVFYFVFDSNLKGIVISYFIATSFYELLIKVIVEKVEIVLNRIFGGNNAN